MPSCWRIPPTRHAHTLRKKVFMQGELSPKSINKTQRLFKNASILFHLRLDWRCNWFSLPGICTMSKKPSPEAQKQQDGGWCRWLVYSQSISAPLFWHGVGGDGGGKQVEELEPKIKRENPRGTVCSGFSAIFQLQTGALNTLMQQQRLFQTQRFLGACKVFSVWPQG